MAHLTPARHRAVAIAWFAACLAAGLALVFFARARLALPGGQELNQLAWEQSFRERGLPVPPSGPREGYWGARMKPYVKDPVLGWREAEAHLPGEVENDARGFQSAEAGPTPRQRVLILGGSVAWGAYASSERTVYFDRLAHLLADRGLGVHVDVLAAGAWTSRNELAALEGPGLATRPGLVLFLDGLNDLTQQRKIPIEQRLADYLRRMGEARRLLGPRRIPVVFALQPFVLEKRHKSRIERRLLELSLDASLPGTAVAAVWPRFRSGLMGLADGREARFLDCSGIMDDATATSFTDLWHFADPVHERLARCLASGLEPLLRRGPTGRD